MGKSKKGRNDKPSDNPSDEEIQESIDRLGLGDATNVEEYNEFLRRQCRKQDPDDG